MATLAFMWFVSEFNFHPPFSYLAFFLGPTVSSSLLFMLQVIYNGVFLEHFGRKQLETMTKAMRVNQNSKAVFCKTQTIS